MSFTIPPLAKTAAIPMSRSFLAAIESYEKRFPGGYVYPLLRQWASEASTRLATLTLLPSGTHGSVALTRAQVRSLLALSLFHPLIVAGTPSYGKLSWDSLHASPSRVSVQRFICLLHYFHRVRFLTPSEEAQRVEYVRCLGSAPDMSVDRPLCEVTFGDMRIEDLPGAMCHVNFANKKLALGIIPSCTQEEILFCFRPEMYVAILVVETLRDDESVVFRGCHRMVQYSGYLGTFQFEGDFVEAPNVAEVVAIDALVNFGGLESTMGGLVRDVTKAYIGFSASSEVIGTGNWGCGAFMGTLELKFVQQVLAASLCTPPRRLMYAAFNPGYEARCRAVQDALVRNKVTTARLWGWCVEYSALAESPQDGCPSFGEFIARKC